MSKSAVIIGGGLGGLFTGAILSKEGLDVTVIEKNAIIGGGLQSFRRFGEVFDTGMHIIGGMQKDGNVRRICEYLGIWDRVHVEDVDPENIDSVYFAEDKRMYKIAQGRSAYVEALCKEFPEQRENLIAYTDALYRLADEVALFHLKPSSDYMQVHSDEFAMSANDFIAKYISDPHLQSVVAYLNPLFGGRKNITPAYVHALISVLYINGPSRFAGGSVLFAETLRDCIIENGGRVITGDAVKTVHSENRMIKGVSTRSGLHFTADYYISDIHPCTLFELMDNPTDLPKPYRSRLQDLPNTYSAFTLNIKLKENSFKYFNHTIYYMTRYEDMWNFGDTDIWPCGFLFMTPPEIGQGEYSRKIIVTAPMSWDRVKQWENTTVGQRGAEYEAWKNEMADRLLGCMEEIYPGFRDCIEDINTASPLTIRDFYGVKEGSMCGYAKDCNNLLLSQIPVVTKIPNLLLTGQNCNLHGFCGVALTSINTSEAILGRNFIVNKLNRFDDIRPYYDSEINAATRRIAQNPLFDKIAPAAFPDSDIEELRNKLCTINSAEEFEKKILSKATRDMLDRTSTEYSCNGLQNLHKDKSYLYISNHRDITVDACCLLLAMLDNGFTTPEVTFGANLMQGEFITDIGKSCKMFKVERPGDDMRAFYRASEHLSDYIRYTIVQKCQSVWIAQRNGRTKDGLDRTDQGLLRMFTMSGSTDIVKSIADLNITPIAISYEWETCDILKSLELLASSKGPYRKKPGEDLNSIKMGLTEQKGKIHLEVCEVISEEELRAYAKLSVSAFCRQVATLIDERICRAYHLSANNYIAHDMLTDSSTYSKFYDESQKTAFCKRMAQLDEYADGEDLKELRKIFLGIYANPIDSKIQFGGKCE